MTRLRRIIATGLGLGLVLLGACFQMPSQLSPRLVAGADSRIVYLFPDSGEPPQSLDGPAGLFVFDTISRETQRVAEHILHAASDGRFVAVIEDSIDEVRIIDLESTTVRRVLGGRVAAEGLTPAFVSQTLLIMLAAPDSLDASKLIVLNLATATEMVITLPDAFGIGPVVAHGDFLAVTTQVPPLNEIHERLELITLSSGERNVLFEDGVLSYSTLGFVDKELLWSERLTESRGARLRAFDPSTNATREIRVFSQGGFEDNLHLLDVEGDQLLIRQISASSVVTLSNTIQVQSLDGQPRNILTTQEGLFGVAAVRPMVLAGETVGFIDERSSQLVLIDVITREIDRVPLGTGP